MLQTNHRHYPDCCNSLLAWLTWSRPERCIMTVSSVKSSYWSHTTLLLSAKLCRHYSWSHYSQSLERIYESSIDIYYKIKLEIYSLTTHSKIYFFNLQW